MCGIVGIVRNDAKAVDQVLLSRMCAAIRHRGPDEDGFYVNGPVGLAMRRLSIIDLKGGQQPIHNQDRTAWIVFNGEIYNYLELREELEKLGHVFYTTAQSICVECLLSPSGMKELKNCFSPETELARNHCCMPR